MHNTSRHKNDDQDIDPIIRFKDQEHHTGIGRTTAYSYIKQGLMPPPIALGPRACGWKLSTLRAWLSSREKLSEDKGGM